MTAAAVPASIIPPGPVWRSLLWLIPLTILWIVLIYWQPFIPASGVPTSAHQLMAHGIIAVGFWLALEATDLTPSQRRTTWLAVMTHPFAAGRGDRRSRPPLPCCRWRSYAVTVGAPRCCCRSVWGRADASRSTTPQVYHIRQEAGLSLPG